MAKDINIKQPIKDGDWNITFSDEQHIEHVLMSAPGHFKNAPLLGVNILQYVNAPLSPKIVSELQRNIKLQLESDGAKNVRVVVDVQTKTITSNGTYN